MNLFFAEHDYQVADFLEKSEEAAQGVWVALGPSAMHILGKKDIPYHIPEDFLSREEIETACVSQFDRLTRVCHQLDELFLETAPFLREWGIRPFLFHLWQLGQVSDVLLCRTLILQKVFSRFPGATAHVHVGPEGKWDYFGLGFSPRDTLWGRLLSLPGWEGRIQRHREPLQAGEKPPRYLRKTIRGALSLLSRKKPLVHSLRSSLQQGWWSNIGNIFRSATAPQRPGLVICNSLYNWAVILPELVSRGHPVYFLFAQDLAKENSSQGTPREAGAASRDPWWEIFRSAFPAWSINYALLLYSRFAFIKEVSPSLAQEMVEKLEAYIAKKDIKAFLIDSGADYFSYIAKQFCRRNAIKVVTWQYGSEWYDRRITQRNDLLKMVSCDKLLVYGDAVKAGYEASPLAREGLCEILSVGSPLLETLRKLETPRKSPKIRILWPFGGYYGNGWYCGFSPPLSDNIYYQEQIKILHTLLSLIRAYPEIYLTIKLQPSNPLCENPPWEEDLVNLDRVRIVKDSPNFVGLLPHHDAVVIDHPTTTLLQAGATGLPLFVLMSVIRWPEEAVRLLRQRAYCADGVEELMEGLTRFIRDGIFPGDQDNAEFLRSYGIHSGNANQLVLPLMEKILHDNI